MCPERGNGLFVAVRGEVVEQDHGAGFDLRHQDFADVGSKVGAIQTLESFMGDLRT